MEEEEEKAAVPSPCLDGCPWIPVGVGGARCPGALGSFSQHPQGSEFPTPALCLIHVLAADTEEKGYALPALRHPWPDIFGLSGAARSPS